jgi:1-acyl-sn-glycerol-3-phosphate acyltransferase
MGVSRQPPPSATKGHADRPADHLLDIVRQLALDLHPDRGRGLEVQWESRLDRDLGIDSLGRAELLSRIEREFRVRLPQSALAEAETPRDLLEALQAAGTDLAAAGVERAQHRIIAAEPGHTAAVAEPASGVPVPAKAATLTEVLDWHAREHPDRPHIVLWDEADREPPVTYRVLAKDARAVARGLLERGFEPGGRAALMLPTGKSFFQAFFGILYAGGIPVPIYPPARLSQLEDHLRRQIRILDNAAVSALVTVPQARPVAAFLKSQVHSLRWVETAEALHSEGDSLAGDGLQPAGETDPERIALLQYTSGSTGDPKGVTLTHANLLANIRAFGERLEVDSTDVCVSWLPLYHDMGLIGTWLGSLYFGGPVVILSPLTFLARPEQWLWAIHRHRGTISAAPNFGFELCLRKIEDGDIEGLDLSCWRMALNGAEPVSPATMRRFTERFAQFGFRPESMAPVYGMAETAVALTIPPPGRPPVVDRVNRAAMSGRGEARPAAPQDENPLEFVACGAPLRGHQVRIVDLLGREVGDRRQGRLQFRGPSSTQGYYRNEAATRQLFDGEWLTSGDLAYIAEGDVYLTGRSKDIIIRAGRNLYPHELEEAIGNLEGVRKGCVAVFAAADPAAGTERIVILVETRLTMAAERDALQRRVEQAATDLLESAPDEVVLAPPHTVPKTSSGKIRRGAARELYETGNLAAGRRALWWQMARLGFSGAVRSAQRAARYGGELLYAVCFWSVLGGIALATWPLVVLLPRRRWRFTVFRAAARLFFGCLAIPIQVSGREQLPTSGAILISNHASYLDGLVLAYALPGGFAVVAKKELLANFVTRLFLRALGALFVERFQAAGSVEDSRAVVAAARRGETVLIFPEGTFTRMPGLLEFRMGAFVSAAESGLPVVPLAMRGTRAILREGQWLPGRAPIHVEIAPPLYPDGDNFEAALRLRDRARSEILSRSGEPDLAGERTILS